MRNYLHSLYHEVFKSHQGDDAKIDRKVILILVYTAVAVSTARYFGNTDVFLGSLLHPPSKFGLWYCSFFYGSQLGRFHSMLFWVLMIVVFYLVIPMMMVRFVFRQPIRDYGFRFRGIHKDYPIYLLMLAIMFPLVWAASSTQPFLDRYPLFQPAKGTLFPVFIYWQIAYLLQFVAVEFFFRGFILHGLKERFGYYAIFIMTIPYCMIHFGKPYAETMAAIPAGIILGALSLKSRSVILGVLIHYSVAISMDIFALWREGYF
jgi:hypothetical protein